MFRIKNLFLLIFVILVSLFYIKNIDADVCIGSQICSNYNVSCNSVGDGFCPENYGNWNACELQSYGKCYPCDPDCGTCGGGGGCPTCNPNETIQMLTQSEADPCSNIDILVTAELSTTPDTLEILDGVDLTSPVLYTDTCNTISCSRTFSNHSVSCVGGDDECLSATSTDLKTRGIKVTKCIEINPEVTASLIGYPTTGTIVVSGNIQINTSVKSLQGVKRGSVYIYKKDPLTNEFRPVKFNTNSNNGDYCSFRCDPLTQPNCNLLGIQEIFTLPQNYDFISNFDTTKCDNKEFKIEVFGYDGRENFNRDDIGDESEFVFTIDNPNPPCIDECIIFNSKLLNTVYFKIKSWIV